MNARFVSIAAAIAVTGAAASAQTTTFNITAENFINFEDTPLESSRNGSGETPRTADGDPFSVAATWNPQDVNLTLSTFLDDVPDDFIFGAGPQNAGALASGPGNAVVDTSDTNVGGNQHLITVIYKSDNGDPLVPLRTPSARGIESEIFFELFVGTGLALDRSNLPDGEHPIQWDQGPVLVREVFVEFFNDGVSVAGEGGTINAVADGLDAIVIVSFGAELGFPSEFDEVVVG
ncbi:MAG: hypothetical protein VYC34_12675, partial [Planctomycetota bacterium]|nr:hypothetical protein [Planctomycetota bacterium]